MSKPARNFHSIDYDDFRKMASDPTLTPNERVGFPESYRKDKEQAILADIVAKTPALSERKKTILDIGCGCSLLPVLLSEHCASHDHELVLVDSKEMLDQLPRNLKGRSARMPGKFPAMPELRKRYAGKADAIVVYSVIQYPYAEGTASEFIEAALELLAHGGVLLIGDIPNRSQRARFLQSPAGIEFHKKLTGTDTLPVIEPIQPGEMTDQFITDAIARYRPMGYDVFVVPQPPELPFGNRREDLVIRKP